MKTSSTKIESSLIGAIIRDYGEPDGERANWYNMAKAKGVTRSTFTDELNAQLWEFIETEVEKKKTPDLVMLDAYNNKLTQYAVEITAETVTGVNFEQWTDELLNMERARRFRSTCQDALQQLEAGKITREEYVAIVTQAEQNNRDDGKTLKTLDDVAEDFDNEYLGDTPPPLIPVFPPNTQLGHDLIFRQGQILVIAAGAGCGKTQLAIQAVIEQLKAGLRVLYICTESVAADIFARLIAPLVGISHYSLLYADRTYDQVARFKAAKQAVCDKYGKRIFIQGIDGGSLSITRFTKLIQEVKNRLGGINVVVIDYIQDIEPIDTKASTNDNMSRTMSIISHTVKQYRAAAIVLSQINRTGQNAKQGEKPNLSWLKDCSKIGELANTVCILTRNDNESRLHCVKSRDCNPFTTRLEYSHAQYTTTPYGDEKYAPPMQSYNNEEL